MHISIRQINDAKNFRVPKLAQKAQHAVWLIVTDPIDAPRGQCRFGGPHREQLLVHAQSALNRFSIGGIPRIRPTNRSKLSPCRGCRIINLLAVINERNTVQREVQHRGGHGALLSE